MFSQELSRLPVRKPAARVAEAGVVVGEGVVDGMGGIEIVFGLGHSASAVETETCQEYR